MSQIRSKNTMPEMVVRSFLFSEGYRYRIHKKDLPGKPDIVLPKFKSVIFINGCFWHGHKGCKYFVLPKTKTDWWEDKINTTRLKDKANECALRALGWNVINVFECELRPDKREQTFLNLVEKIGNGHTRN